MLEDTWKKIEAYWSLCLERDVELLFGSSFQPLNTNDPIVFSRRAATVHFSVFFRQPSGWKTKKKKKKYSTGSQRRQARTTLDVAMELSTSPSRRGPCLGTKDPRQPTWRGQRSWPASQRGKSACKLLITVSWRISKRTDPLWKRTGYTTAFFSLGDQTLTGSLGSLEGENQPGEWICQGSSKREEEEEEEAERGRARRCAACHGTRRR